MHGRQMTVVVICCFVSVVQGQEAKKDDTAILKGKWNAISYIEDGETASRLDKTPIEWVFEKEQLTIIAHDQQVLKIKGACKFDQKADPKTIDVRIDKQGDIPEQSMKGIYRMEKGQLTICYAPDGKRPAVFASEQGTGVVLIVLERK